MRNGVRNRISKGNGGRNEEAFPSAFVLDAQWQLERGEMGSQRLTG